MTNFNEADHPRISDGTFTNKPQTLPELSLPAQPPVADGLSQHYIDIAEEAGLPGIGPHILDIAVFASDIPDDDDAGDRRALITAEHLTYGYEQHVAPAIDKIAAIVDELPLEPSPDWEQKVADAADAAGVPVMAEVCTIIAQRGELIDPSVLGSLTADQLEALHLEHLRGPIYAFGELLSEL